MAAFTEKEFEEVPEKEVSEIRYFSRNSGGRDKDEKLEEVSETSSLNRKLEEREDVEELPMPGLPDFWASTDVELEEELEPPTRNRPTSAPWEE
jgi:hypothetical protein